MHQIADSKYYLQIYNIYIFSILGVAFAISFLCYFQKLQLLVVKKKKLLHCTSIYISSKNVLKIFKILFQTGNIKIFVLRGVFFSRYVRLKGSFLEENSISGEISDTLQQRSYRKLTWQSINRKFHHWQKWELCKVVHNVKLY